MPTAKIIGTDPTEPRLCAGQPGVDFETKCDHCGRTSLVKLSWEQARQYIATLQARLAENMRKLPRGIA